MMDVDAEKVISEQQHINNGNSYNEIIKCKLYLDIKTV